MPSVCGWVFGLDVSGSAGAVRVKSSRFCNNESCMRRNRNKNNSARKFTRRLVIHGNSDGYSENANASVVTRGEHDEDFSETLQNSITQEENIQNGVSSRTLVPSKVKQNQSDRKVSRLGDIDAALDEAFETNLSQSKVEKKSTDIFLELDYFLKHSDRSTAAFVSAGVAALLFVTSLLLKEYSYPIPAVLESPPPIPLQPLSFWQLAYMRLTGPELIVALSMGVSAFTQALTGFGFAIVSVSLLSQQSWITNSSVFEDIQPIAACFGFFVGTFLVLPEFNKVDFRQIAPVAIASVCAAPVGALALNVIDEGLALRALGGLIVGFVVYLFSGLKPPKWFASQSGSVFWGSLAGLFGGAFDIQGPPLVFYAQATDWDPERLRRNVLAIVTINSLAVIIMDAFSGRLEDYYVKDFLVSGFPLVFLGVLAGKALSTRLNPLVFKRIVLTTCALMGGRLLLS
mmetsp:Transcript_3759/g.6568  ORF Transcript_3759/g.6568 Transcript_3759/m.6568 type:complete len:458 (-) Transcript_3759:719-2092(-)